MFPVMNKPAAAVSNRGVRSFFPLSSTITMPGRIVAGDTSWWEPVASLLIPLVAAVFVILVSERMYRRPDADRRKALHPPSAQADGLNR